jgi:hypothetical protein
LIDPDYLKDRNRKVFCQVLAAFRYGREDLDVLGLTFRKDLFFATSQIFPPTTSSSSSSDAAATSGNGGTAGAAGTGDKPRTPTRLQERLIKKLGPNAYPFFFELPPNCPASVTLQPAPGDTGKPCGIDYELRAFVAESAEEKLHKRLANGPHEYLIVAFMWGSFINRQKSVRLFCKDHCTLWIASVSNTYLFQMTFSMTTNGTGLEIQFI